MKTRCSLRRSTGLVLNAEPLVAITFDVAVHNHGKTKIFTPENKIIVPKSGLYMVLFQSWVLDFAGDTDLEKKLSVWIGVNGNANYICETYEPVIKSYHAINVSGIRHLAKGDEINLYAANETGEEITIEPSYDVNETDGRIFEMVCLDE